MSENNKKLINYVETTFECSGICQSNLFYWMEPISNGPPKNACLDKLWEKIGETILLMGAPALGAGIILFFAFICQYPLWCYD